MMHLNLNDRYILGGFNSMKMNKRYMLMIILNVMYVFFLGTMFWRVFDAADNTASVIVLILVYILSLICFIHSIFVYIKFICKEIHDQDWTYIISWQKSVLDNANQKIEILSEKITQLNKRTENEKK